MTIHWHIYVTFLHKMLIKSKLNAHLNTFPIFLRFFLCESFFQWFSYQCNFFNAIICFWISTAERKAFSVLVHIVTRRFESDLSQSVMSWYGNFLSYQLFVINKHCDGLFQSRNRHNELQATMNVRNKRSWNAIFATNYRNKYIKVGKWMKRGRKREKYGNAQRDNNTVLPRARQFLVACNTNGASCWSFGAFVCWRA